MKKLGLVLVGLLVLVALPGCGSSDDGPNAPQQCKDLAASFCETVVGCQVSGGFLESSEQAAQIAECKSDLESEIECPKAVGVSSSYQACMSKLANPPPCDQINQAIEDQTLEIPSECNGTILISN
ncbi:MAG TPA: hypothetical protein VJV79_22110 [Polyangiaceae bacterium]|nr:hypothetical protein [Polyangiaceae bacterium]